MNSYPVYQLEKDLVSVLTNKNLPCNLEISCNDRIYQILNPATKAKVLIEQFDNRPDYMVMVYNGKLAENRELAAIVGEIIIASGGRIVIGEDLDRAL